MIKEKSLEIPSRYHGTHSAPNAFHTQELWLELHVNLLNSKLLRIIDPHIITFVINATSAFAQEAAAGRPHVGAEAFTSAVLRIFR